MTKEKLIEAVDCNLFYLIIGSLISADNLVDTQSCENALGRIVEMEAISKELTTDDLPQEQINKCIEYICSAKEIINKNLRSFKEE